MTYFSWHFSHKMVCSHFILNILLSVTEFNNLSSELKLSKKNSFILYYGFFKYGHVDTNIWNRLIAKALFLLYRLNVTYMQWWKSVCNLSQPTKNEKKNILCLFSCTIYDIITEIQPKKGEMLLLSRLLSVVVDIILFYVFFQTNNYTIMKKINPLETEKTK